MTRTNLRHPAVRALLMVLWAWSGRQSSGGSSSSSSSSIMVEASTPRLRQRTVHSDTTQGVPPPLFDGRRRLEESLEALYVQGNDEEETVVGEDVDMDGGETGETEMNEGNGTDVNGGEPTPPDAPPSATERPSVPLTPPQPSPPQEIKEQQREEALPAVTPAEREVEDPLLPEEGTSTFILNSISLTAQRCLGLVAALLGMIWTAYQVAENPDGLYANLCRSIISVFGFFCRIVTCKSCMGAHRHIPVSTMEYAYRVNGTEETMNFK